MHIGSPGGGGGGGGSHYVMVNGDVSVIWGAFFAILVYLWGGIQFLVYLWGGIQL